MAILIVSMDIPVSCSACPVSEYAADSSCRLIQKTTNYDEFIAKRRDDCPLREIKLIKEEDKRLLEDAGFEL